MADKPILFSAPMVRALLAGTKTQTRRIIKLPTRTHSGGPIYERPDMGGWAATTHGGGGCFTIAKDGSRVPVPERAGLWHQTTGVCVAPPIAPGDRLWVREAHYLTDDGDSEFAVFAEDASAVADHLEQMAELKRTHPQVDWSKHLRRRPAIHMPRWASRITLTVTDVRVQRLQDIDEMDAMAEGVELETADPPFYYVPGIWPHNLTAVGVEEREWRKAARCYGKLWNHISGPGAWEANPWVAAYSFTVRLGNIDAEAADA